MLEHDQVQTQCQAITKLTTTQTLNEQRADVKCTSHLCQAQSNSPTALQKLLNGLVFSQNCLKNERWCFSRITVDNFIENHP